jgi:hypothetical protein
MYLSLIHMSGIFLLLMLSGQNYILAPSLHEITRLMGYMVSHESFKLQIINLRSLLHISFKSLFLKNYIFFSKNNTYLSIKESLNSLK